jgi:hypothetical protein
MRLTNKIKLLTDATSVVIDRGAFSSGLTGFLDNYDLTTSARLCSLIGYMG